MSTVARSMASFVVLVLGMVSVVSAQMVVAPSNASLPDDEANSLIPLRLAGGPSLQNQPLYKIAPLTTMAGKGASQQDIKGISYTGNVRMIGPQNISLASTDIAFISCDDTGTSNITPSNVVAQAGQQTPKGIVLYSNSLNECNLTGFTTFNSIYTMTKLEDTQAILNSIRLYNDPTNILTAQIGSNSTSPGSGSQSNNQGPPTPTTAVAMSILYSITGIITLLFLIIIATGAVRAHRHPERYGPRNGYSGRPRQSRAKGLARAMLETLPIVKFGDPEPAKPGSRDVELENGNPAAAPPAATAHDVNAEQTGTVNADTATTEPTETAKPSPVPAAALPSGMGPAEGESAKDSSSTDGAAVAASVQEGELGCSICTEDFTTGEDVRVLPCNHKYHPACIDPWLLNVSGTCPLCRHDLRPDAGAGTATDELPPPLDADNHTVANEATDDPDNTRHRRRSRLLDLTRLRHAPPDERIAALRQLREQSRAEGEPAVGETEDVEDHQSRRTRLTGRLRGIVRTRPRTEAGATSPPNPTQS